MASLQLVWWPTFLAYIASSLQSVQNSLVRIAPSYIKCAVLFDFKALPTSTCLHHITQLISSFPTGTTELFVLKWYSFHLLPKGNPAGCCDFLLMKSVLPTHISALCAHNNIQFICNSLILGMKSAAVNFLLMWTLPTELFHHHSRRRRRKGRRMNTRRKGPSWMRKENERTRLDHQLAFILGLWWFC